MSDIYEVGGSRVGINSTNSVYFQLHTAARRAGVREIGIFIAVASTNARSLW